MTRTPCYDRIRGLKRGTWTAEEDSKLIAYVTKYGHWNWRLLPKFAGLARCGKSCRLRWLNYLRPNIKRGCYTQEEEETIIKLHEKLGNRWSAIAAHLPGRSDNDIKNHWHATLKKRSPQNSITDEKAKISDSKNKTPIEIRKERELIINYSPNSQTPTTCEMEVLPFSAHSSPGEFSCITTCASSKKLVPEDDFSSMQNCTEPVSSYFWTDPYLVDFSDLSGELPAVTNPDYLNPVYDAELWSTHNSLYEDCGSLF